MKNPIDNIREFDIFRFSLGKRNKRLRFYYIFKFFFTGNKKCYQILKDKIKQLNI